MDAPWRKMIRFAGLLFVAFLLGGCATYPADQDPNIDYEGRWQEGGPYNAYEYVDSIQHMYRWSGGTYGSAYDEERKNRP